MKKKFVRKQNPNESMRKSQIKNFDEDPEHQGNFKLEFNDKQILHLWLVQILPGSGYSGFRVNLLQKKLVGDLIQCQRKLQECKRHIQNSSLKAVNELEQQIDDNMSMAIRMKFDAKIFPKSAIQDACEQIITKFKYRKIEQVLHQIKDKRYFYLISIQKLIGLEFQNWYQQNKNAKFSRVQISRLKNQSGLSRIRSEKSILSVSSLSNSRVSENNYYTYQNKAVDEQKQSSVQDEASSEEDTPSNFYKFYDKQGKDKKNNQGNKTSRNTTQKSQIKPDQAVQRNQDIKKKKYVKKQYNPSKEQIDNASYIRKPQRQNKVFEKQVHEKYFNEGNFKYWVNNNKMLKWHQIRILKENGKVNVILITTQDKQKKIQSLNIFFNFQKIILLESLSKDHREQLKKQFCSGVQQSIKCQLIEGFMEPKTHQHKLRHLINQNKISKSPQRTIKFSALKIVGMKNHVQQLEQEIKIFISELPEDDKNQNMVLSLQQIELYLFEDKVKQFVEKTLRQYVKRYTQFKLIEVHFANTKVVLNLSIQYNSYNDFMEKKYQNIIQQIQKHCFTIDEIIDESDYIEDFKDKFLLYKSQRKPGKYVIITQKNKYIDQAKQIMQTVTKNNTKISEKQLNFKKSRYLPLKKFIQSILGDQNRLQLKDSLKTTYQNESKLTIYGVSKFINQLHMIIQDFLAKLDSEATEKTFFVNDESANLIEKNMEKFKKVIQKQFGLSFQLNKNVDLGVVVTLGTDTSFFQSKNPLTILIQKNKNIQRLPSSALICFQSQSDLNYFTGKQLTQFKAFVHGRNKVIASYLKDTNKDLHYVYNEGYKNVGQMMKQLWSLYPLPNAPIRTFAFFMPKLNKKQFIIDLLFGCQPYLANTRIKIHLFEQLFIDLKQSLAGLKDLYVKPQKQYRYYVVDQKQFYYSQSGDQKIRQAIEKGKKFVYLTNEDLNLQVITHILSLKDMKLTHIQSQTQTKIQKLSANRYMFTLKGTQFIIPDKQLQIALAGQRNGQQQVQVSIGAYELDLTKMKQTNMFSNFVRNLQKKQANSINKPIGNLHVSFDEKVNEIQIVYQKKDENKVTKACEAILQLVEDERIKLTHVLDKPMRKEQFELLKTAGQQVDVKVQWDGGITLTFSGFEKASITSLMKNIKLYQIESKTIKYPEAWCKQQSQIETFIVAQDTKQFKQIQKAFKIAPIKELKRIQNMLVYKKYEDEKECLTKLNEGKAVQEMMLFHGTRGTDPAIIYQDKQECFNINYTGDSNYLGRGTYFAVEPVYSHSYAYVDKNLSGGFFGIGATQTRKMFYCSVLIGDSQKIAEGVHHPNKRDTEYKDTHKKIRYESATTFTNGSVIYTVYKNRRAYPNYLITY